MEMEWRGARVKDLGIESSRSRGVQCSASAVSLVGRKGKLGKQSRQAFYQGKSCLDAAPVCTVHSASPSTRTREPKTFEWTTCMPHGLPCPDGVGEG